MISPLAAFFRQEVRVINLGLEQFAGDLARLGVPVVHVAWTPPAGGDPKKAALLAKLADEDEDDA
jgi:hypothetical protein